MILPKMSHMVVPISKENMVTHTSIIVSGSCLPYPTKNVKLLYLTLDEYAGQTTHYWQCLSHAEAVFMWKVQSSCAVAYGLHISYVSADAVCLLQSDSICKPCIACECRQVQDLFSCNTCTCCNHL